MVKTSLPIRVSMLVLSFRPCVLLALKLCQIFRFVIFKFTGMLTNTFVTLHTIYQVMEV